MLNQYMMGIILNYLVFSTTVVVSKPVTASFIPVIYVSYLAAPAELTKDSTNRWKQDEPPIFLQMNAGTNQGELALIL